MRLEQAACAEAAVEAAADKPGENSEADGKVELPLGLGLEMASGDGVGMEAGGVSSPTDEVVVVVIDAGPVEDVADANEAHG